MTNHTSNLLVTAFFCSLVLALNSCSTTVVRVGIPQEAARDNTVYAPKAAHTKANLTVIQTPAPQKEDKAVDNGLIGKNSCIQTVAKNVVYGLDTAFLVFKRAIKQIVQPKVLFPILGISGTAAMYYFNGLTCVDAQPMNLNHNVINVNNLNLNKSIDYNSRIDYKTYGKRCWEAYIANNLDANDVDKTYGAVYWAVYNTAYNLINTEHKAERVRVDELDFMDMDDIYSLSSSVARDTAANITHRNDSMITDITHFAFESASNAFLDPDVLMLPI